MKTVLILSYYFPPGNLTPAERVASYASAMYCKGYKVIVVTRNWDIPLQKMEQRYASSGKDIIVDNTLGYEVHYVPYRSTLTNKLFLKLTGHRLYFIYKIMAFVFKLLENFTSHFTGLTPIYKEASNIIQNENVDVLIASASPFHLFKFASKLSRKHNVPWIADYRDDWTTNELVNQGRIKKVVRWVNQFSEKKWLRNVSFFVSVSDFYVEKIKGLINKPGYVIENGFIKDLFPNTCITPYEKFTISYIGSLYPVQPIELFLTAFIKFINTGEKKDCQFLFIGLAADFHGLSRVQEIIKGYEEHFTFTERLRKIEAIELQRKSHILFHCSYAKLKGIPGSKLYDFLGVRKPVVLYPTDNDILEGTLRRTKQGIFPTTETECINELHNLYALWKNNELKHFLKADEQVILSYSREQLGNKFTLKINELFSN